MTITKDQIAAIKEQYPVMYKIVDEVCPRQIRDEVHMWSRFFQSRLYMALRGMKIDKNSEPDPVLDQYLDLPEITGLRPKATESSYIPKFIDLEGNEENNSQRKGNLDRFEHDQMILSRAPAIRKLNALSEKLMSAVKPSEVEASAPIGMDEAEYQALRLRDLADDPEQNRIKLNIRDQSNFFTDQDTSSNQPPNPFSEQDPAEAVKRVCADISSHFPQPGQGPIPIAPIAEDEYDEDDDAAEDGSTAATAHIFSLINAHKEQTAPISPTSGLSTAIYDRVILTHATTIEFLRQFWNAFLSGDAQSRQ